MKVNEGSNQYCGPAVLSILTGKTVDEYASLFAPFRSKGEVTSVTYPELVTVLEKLRYKFTVFDTNCSLYMAMIQASKHPGFYIVGLPKHVGALEVTEQGQVYFCDNHTKEQINGAASARLMQKVDKLIKVELKPEPVFIKNEIQLITDSRYSEILIIINRIGIYKEVEDNTKTLIGTLRMISFDELDSVCEKLREFQE